MRKQTLLLLQVLLSMLIIGCSKDDQPEVLDEPYDKSITAIVIQENHIWVGTAHNGLYHFDGESWSVFTHSAGLASDTITALATGANGKLWVGTNKGISKFENQTWTSWTDSEGLFNNDIRCLHADQMNNVWIGTRNNRLVKFDGSSFTNFHVNPAASGPGELGHIHTITHDQAGNIWVGSCISGLSMFDGTSWFDLINGLSVFVFSSICDPEGNIWIGHLSGAYKFSDNTWTNFSETDGLISNSVFCLAADQHNNIWMGTDAGLSKFDGETWSSFTTSNGLIDNNIKALACDQEGNIWVGTPTGLTILEKTW